jgi:hypothetical protein
MKSLLKLFGDLRCRSKSTKFTAIDLKSLCNLARKYCLEMKERIAELRKQLEEKKKETAMVTAILVQKKAETLLPKMTPLAISNEKTPLPMPQKKLASIFAPLKEKKVEN